LDYISVADSLGISSTTFTQCAPNANDFAEITKITATTPFKVIQGHRFWCQSKAHVECLLVITTNLRRILHRFRDIDSMDLKLPYFATPLGV